MADFVLMISTNLHRGVELTGQVLVLLARLQKASLLNDRGVRSTFDLISFDGYKSAKEKYHQARRRVKVFIHIGAPKTGTTALQRFFFRQRREVRRSRSLLPARGSNVSRRKQRKAPWVSFCHEGDLWLTKRSYEWQRTFVARREKGVY